MAVSYLLLLLGYNLCGCVWRHRKLHRRESEGETHHLQVEGHRYVSRACRRRDGRVHPTEACLLQRRDVIEASFLDRSRLEEGHDLCVHGPIRHGKTRYVWFAYKLLISPIYHFTRYMSYKHNLISYKLYFITHYTGSAQWNHYSVKEHLFNCRAFEQYMTLDRKIVQSSSEFNNLPSDSATKSKSRRASTAFSTTSDESPVQKRFKYNKQPDTESDDSSSDASVIDCTDDTAI